MKNFTFAKGGGVNLTPLAPDRVKDDIFYVMFTSLIMICWANIYQNIWYMITIGIVPRRKHSYHFDDSQWLVVLVDRMKFYWQKMHFWRKFWKISLLFNPFVLSANWLGVAPNAPRPTLHPTLCPHLHPFRQIIAHICSKWCAYVNQCCNYTKAYPHWNMYIIDIRLNYEYI